VIAPSLDNNLLVILIRGNMEKHLAEVKSICNKAY